jgi:hypothetical protein
MRSYDEGLRCQDIGLGLREIHQAAPALLRDPLGQNYHSVVFIPITLAWSCCFFARLG